MFLEEITSLKNDIGKEYKFIKDGFFRYAYSSKFNKEGVECSIYRRKNTVLLTERMSGLPLMSFEHSVLIPDTFGPPQIELAKLNEGFDKYQEQINTELLYEFEACLRCTHQFNEIPFHRIEHVNDMIIRLTETPINVAYKGMHSDVLGTATITRESGVFSAAKSFVVTLNTEELKFIDKLLLIHEYCHVLDYYWTRSVGHTPSFLFLYGKLLSNLIDTDVNSWLSDVGFFTGAQNEHSGRNRFYSNSNIERIFLF